MSYFSFTPFCFIVILCFVFTTHNLKAKPAPRKFVLVIDPGHGGEDAGARGYGGVREKDVTLEVALSLGELIQKKNKDVTVIYTRETDVFIPLQERARIANKNKADFFISIHCNASKNTTASGSETYVLGLHRNDENFEVSKRENSVIFLEDNYEEKYEGFNPNSPESVIGITLLQNIHLDNSIIFAKLIEDNHKLDERLSRGVKQAGFLVLRQTAMPSILTEIGFISNPDEGASLVTEEGKNQVVNVLFNSFESYKQIVDDRLKTAGVDFEKPQNKEYQSQKKASNNGLYKIQLFTSTSLIKENSAKFKNLKSITTVKDKELYKYYFGETESEEEAKLKLNQAKKVGFIDAFILEQNVNLKESYAIQLLSSTKKKDLNFLFEEKGIFGVSKITTDGITKYYYNQSNNLSEVKINLYNVRKKGFKDAFIVFK
ncbi:MAG: N-acetylmuramoyl-L-alanine amidase [Solirubrobacteraceae bacterium]